MYRLQTGLTLIELIITCTLIGIIALYSIPFYEEFHAKQESKKTQLILKDVIKQAKILAILYKKEIKICPSNDGTHCSQTHWNDKILLYSEQNQIALGHYSLHLRYGQLQWQGSLKKEYIIFQPDTGTPRGHIGHFNYSTKNQHLNFKATLNMMGIFSIQSYTHLV